MMLVDGKICKMLQGCKTLDMQTWAGGRLLLRFRNEWLLQTRRKKDSMKAQLQQNRNS